MWPCLGNKVLKMNMLIGFAYGEFEAAMVSVFRDSSSVQVDLFLPLEDSLHNTRKYELG